MQDFLIPELLQGMQRTLILAVVLAGVANAASLDPDWLEVMEQGGATGPNRFAEGLPGEGTLTFRSGDYTLIVAPSVAFNIFELHYRDQPIILPTGAQGAVILTERGAESTRDTKFQGDPWIGTGHGGELVWELTCMVDGKEQHLHAGLEVRGEEIILGKRAVLYKFDHEVEITLTPVGMVESRVLRATEPIDGLQRLYLFMYSWNPIADEWLAGHADGQEVSGDFETRFHLGRDGNQVRWYAQFVPDRGWGLLQYTPDLIPGQNLVHVALPRYHKYYSVLPVKDRHFAAGEIIDHTMIVRVVEDGGDGATIREAVAEMDRGWRPAMP